MKVDESAYDSVMAGRLKTILFLGSTREGRMGLRVAKFMKKQFEAANHTVELCGNVEFQSEQWVSA